MSNVMIGLFKLTRFIFGRIAIALIIYGTVYTTAFAEENSAATNKNADVNSATTLEVKNIGQAPLVLVSIKPVHSLVAGIMKGAGEPILLLKGASSPHSFQLKPSDAVLIEKAALIVRIGPSLEVPLNKVFHSLSKASKVMNVIELKEIEVLKFRSPHHHEEEEEHSVHEAGEHASEEHSTENTDPHLWLNLNNARQIVLQVSNRLILMDPSNGGLYERNANEVLNKLKTLADEISRKLQPLSGKGYMVFHDAYQYYTEPYGLNFAGSITLNPSTPPSAKHLKELRAELAHEDVGCVFAEPQYSDKILKALTEGSNVKTSMLDPIGVNIDAGEDAYFLMMRDMTNSLADCLR